MTRQLRRKAAAFLAAFVVSISPVTAQTLVLPEESEDLRQPLENAAQSLNPAADNTAADIVALAKGDYERLLSALYGEGHYGPQISIRLAGREASGVSVLSPPLRVRPVTITIDPGPRFRFGRTEIDPLPQGASRPEAFRRDEPAKLPVIRDAAALGVEAWREASHAKAELTDQQITARHAARRLDVILRVTPGPALRFGELIVPEDAEVRPRRLKAIAGLPKRKPYHPDEIAKARQRLVDTGAFRSVVLREAETPNADGTLDVSLEVEEAVPRRIGFGAEITSSEGLSLEAFWLHRNAFGGAERLRFDFNVDGIGGQSGGQGDGLQGGIDYRLGTTLSIPGFQRPEDTLTFEAVLQRLDEPNFVSNTARIGVNRERKFDDGRIFSVGTSLRYSETEDDVYGIREFAHLVLEGRAILDRRDDTLRPRAGFYAEALLEPFIGVNDSASGLRGTGDFRLYRAIGSQSVLAARLQLGTVIGPEIDETPPEFLFFSGGGGTVRGQEFQSLGVMTGNDIVGGRSFLGLSGEVRQDLTDTITLVAFYDTGAIGTDSDFSNLESHAGFGAGLRYNTGFGPLRVDIGFPVADADAGDFQLYIGLGEAF